MSANQNEAIRLAADTAGKKAKAVLTEDMQYLIVRCLPNISNGAFWGFTTVEDAVKHADCIKANPKMAVRKVRNGCIVETDPNYIIKCATTALPGVITQGDIQSMKEAMGKAEGEFIKFLIRKGKGGAFQGKIGIYCINDTAAVILKGVNYPAFRLPASRVLELCNTYGYAIKVGDKFMRPADAFNLGKGFWESLEISPTSTAVFCEIKAMKSVDEYTAMEKELKAQLKASK